MSGTYAIIHLEATLIALSTQGAAALSDACQRLFEWGLNPCSLWSSKMPTALKQNTETRDGRLIQRCSNIIFLFLTSEFTELTNQILVRDKETKQLLTTHTVQAWKYFICKPYPNLIIHLQRKARGAVWMTQNLNNNRTTSITFSSSYHHHTSKSYSHQVCGG